MRTIKEWTTGSIRVTILHMNNKYTIKMERGLLEQNYKFRDGTFDNPAQIEAYMNDQFYANAQSIFDQMIANKVSAQKDKSETDDFDEII